jgi:hypothetical protein
MLSQDDGAGTSSRGEKSINPKCREIALIGEPASRMTGQLTT